VVAHAHDGSKIPRIVTSCDSCLAWGQLHAQGLCLDCYNFSTPRYGHHVGDCGACHRRQPLKKGYCRLCWMQAREDRLAAEDANAWMKQMIAPHLSRVRHHQLFLAGMHGKHVAKPRCIERRRGAKGRPAKPPPPPVTPPRPGWVQPTLFDEPITRVYRYGHVDLRRAAAPDNPWLAWALRLAHTNAEARGWAPAVRRRMQRTLVMLLSDYRPGEPLRVSDFQQTVVWHCANLDYVLEILTTMQVVVDDRPAPLEPWLQATLTGLAEAIRHDTIAWARSLRDGSPRTRPRDPRTVRIYVAAVEPPLAQWSIRCDHLREIIRDDVTAYLATLTGSYRQTAATALRSLFRWAKRTNLIFPNPTAGIRLPRKTDTVWQPLRPDELGASVRAADTPQAQLFVALAAIHAARPVQIRALHLDDVDLSNRRITIAGHERPLDDLTYHALHEWLDHRRQRWPHTANPHLLISIESALRHGPVSHAWILNLRGLPATLERLRIDRQLEEAIASGGDPLHIAAVFGISDTAAVRYAVNARKLRQDTHAAPPDSS
jgi:integrase